MKHNLFKIGKILMGAIFMLVCNMNISAQKTQLQLLTEDNAYCDKQKFDVNFLVNMPVANDFYIVYTIYANNVEWKTIDEKKTGSDLKEGTELKTDVPESFTIDVDLSDTDLSKILSDLRHVEYRFSFSLVYDYYGIQKKVAADRDLIVNVWATPKPQIITPDKDDICGFKVDFKADTHWEDISTYKWETSNEFLSLKNTNTKICSGVLQSDAERSCEVTLYETTGGMCTLSDTRTFNFKRLPEASIAPTDNSEQFICTSLDDDPAFSFSGNISVEGNGPFSIILSNGQEFSNLPETMVTKELVMKQSGELTISSVVDSNGCSADESGMTGSIVVIDRKPQLSVPTDTIEFEGREVFITREKTNTDKFDAVGKESEIRFYWEIIDTYHHHGQWDNTNSDKVDKIISNESYGYTSDPSVVFLRFRTNKTGYINTQYTEWNIMEDHQDCYNSIVQTVNTFDVVNAPNGFSPNADLKNDFLVIEGIPDQNHLTIYDAKGKIIYDKKNYRNNWNAEGIDDGYYVYIFEGEGIKTIKETLVIKRKKK